MPSHAEYEGLTLAEALRHFAQAHFAPKTRHISRDEYDLLQRAAIALDWPRANQFYDDRLSSAAVDTLQLFRARGLRVNEMLPLCEVTDYGGIRELTEGGYLNEYLAALELTERGERQIYGDESRRADE